MSEYSKRNVRFRKAQKEQDYVQDFERLFDEDCHKEKRSKEDPPSECLDLLSAELLNITEVMDVPGLRMTEYRKAKKTRRTRQTEENYALKYQRLFDKNYHKQKLSKEDLASECLDLLSTQLLERTEVMHAPVTTVSECSKQELKSGNKQKVQMPLEEADCVVVQEHFEGQPPQEESESECEDNTGALVLENKEVLEAPGFIYSYWKGKSTKRRRDRERTSICLFTPQVAATARDEAILSQELLPGTDEDSDEEELTLLRAAEEPRDILDYID